MKNTLFTLLLLFIVGITRAAITTPYPETIELKQINSAEKERVRLCQGHKKYDRQPTGFYVEAGKTVEVNVEILTAADQNVMPSLIVGTMGFNVAGRSTGVSTTLKAGVNRITNHSGGLIWLSFLQNTSADPKGVARITFTGNSEHVRAPRFVLYTTSTAEFREMLTEYQTPDVLYQSDYALVVATKEAANLYSKDNNKVQWLNSILTLLEEESKISGLDDNDPNPVHHRLKPGEVRFLLVENTSTSPHANSAGYTGYPSASRNRYLTVLGTSSNNTWMLGHELGHQHQQPAYMIDKSTESTVNIYSYVTERLFYESNSYGNNADGLNYNRTSAARWQQAKASYLLLPFSKRIYNMADSDLEGVTGFNRDELRFMPWEQLFLIFGDEFYKTLHRVVREEGVISGGGEERRAYLIWKASQVTGYDLTEFFNIWGIRVTDSALKAELRAKMAYAKSQSTILDLSAIGRTPENLVYNVTGQSRPDWIPIAMRGVTSGDPAPQVLDRTNWTITTSHNGPSDSTVGGDKPEYIIDSDTQTAFAFVKPSVGSYGGITVGPDDPLWFTIDMGEKVTFNYVNYMHRYYNNAYNLLRARQISVYGSDDGTSFTPIKEAYVIDHEQNANEIVIEFAPVSYRFIKVTIDDWSRDGGSTVQVADFTAGVKVLSDYPVPDPIKYRVKVTADEGIVTSQAGTNPADEDSDYTITFTLAADKTGASATVDGEKVELEKVGDEYSLTVTVSNHLDINITSSGGTNIELLSAMPAIHVYPNPVKAGQPFSIRADGDFSGSEATIYSLSGTKLFDCKVNGKPVCIGYPGFFILNVHRDAQRYTTKIIVE